MPRSDPVQGITTPLGTELPDGAAMSASVVDQLVVKTVMWFSTTTTRDAAIASGARKAGMLCYVDSLGYWYGVKVNAGAWVKLTTDTYAGTEVAIVGSSPPAGTIKIRQEFSAVATTVGSGGLNFYFPTAFGNGITSLCVTAGDRANNLGYLTTDASGCGLAAWFGVAYQPGGAIVASLPVRGNVVAVGW